MTQEWSSSHIQYDSGKMDGFVTTSQAESMGYWTGADLPFTYSLAGAFPVGDRWFCSVLGQTNPNRRYLIAVTSAGMTDGTIFNLLDAHGISWENYVYSYPTGATPELYAVNDTVTEVLHHKALDDFFSDAASGRLPSFSLIDPDYTTQSQEDPQNIVVGEKFAASVIDAVMNGPGWSRTLLVWNYDEHGGYFDHVPPPPALAPDDILPQVLGNEPRYNGFHQYGFRVPMAVISPWSRPNYVSHVVNDHTSVCALVEAKWNLPAMTYRDANAGNLLDMVDLRYPAFLRPPRLAKPLLDTDPSSQKCSVTGPGHIPPPGSVSPPPA